MSILNEDLVERAAISTLEELGYAYRSANAISPDGFESERQSYGEVLLRTRLEAAVDRINPDLPESARREAISRVVQSETQNLDEENRRLHRLIVEGVDVDFRADDGTMRGSKVWLIDFANPTTNDFLVTNQFTVIERGHNRRPDVVVFVNGLPLAVIELKNPRDENATIDGAYNQLQTYKAEIPSLFRTNAVLITSDGMLARIGSVTAGKDRFMPWRTVTGAADDFTAPGMGEQDTLLRGVFEPTRFLKLLQDFTLFGDKGDGPFKIIAGYHQFHGAQSALKQAIAATRPDGDRKAGVVWHTQGSGKSFLMAFTAGLLVKDPALENPTVVVITDRNDLDDQLFGTFNLCSDLIRQKPQQADSRDDVRRLLERASGGVIFTTMQKFAPDDGEEEFPCLSSRANVLVMADEAHRSQYGFSSKLDAKTGKRRYGYAHYLRQALPNASFMGFTGTPIEAEDVNTPAVFGEYVDIYDITRAVSDFATVPIYYESRLARIDLADDQKPLIDAEIEAMLEDETLSEREKEKAKRSTVEALVGAEPRLEKVAADLVDHLEARIDGMGGGKAMAVCMSREICVNLYNKIVELRPDWHSDDQTAGAIKVIMTGSASDPEEWRPHVGNKKSRDDLAIRARDVDDPLKLVIVRDMWLTGFDAPCMHTMYVDKPMRGHGLMQAIARVNRVFEGKSGGLVVDYIGIGQNLKKALQQYTQSDAEKTGIDEEQAVAMMQRELEVVRDIFHGHDYSQGIDGEPQERLAALASSIDWVGQWTHGKVAGAENDEDRKAARRLFNDYVLSLSKAYSLASASDEGKAVRDEIGYFQACRAVQAKTTAAGSISTRDRMLAINQLIDQAVAGSEIVDILTAAGMKSPDISILSEDFLDELAGFDKRNLALEALEKLLNGEIKSHARTNVVEARKFSQMLEDAVARYHANAISTVDAIQTLIGVAKDFKSAVQQGGEEHATPEERAFYSALAEHDQAVEVMGSDELKIIAAELIKAMQSNATVDWHKRDNARKRMRVLVKRILKRFGYPPDLSDFAVQNVLAQAEAFLDENA
ncbi:MAG: type I restriction endonuclease subunit R [Alphaproteobacteria bacterium]